MVLLQEVQDLRPVRRVDDHALKPVERIEQTRSTFEDVVEPDRRNHVGVGAAAQNC